MAPSDSKLEIPNRASSEPAESEPAEHELTERELTELASRLRLSAARLARRLRQESATGLSLSLLSALAVINSRGPMTLGALAEAEGVAPPTITRIAQRLEADGLVERITDDDDKRLKFVEATPEGKELLHRSRDRRNAWLSERLSSLDAADLASIARVVNIFEEFNTDPDADPSAVVPDDLAEQAAGR